MSADTPFAELAEVLHPGATGTDLAALLDGKAGRTVVLAWKAGRRGTPQWALELLQDKLRQRHERERAIAERAAKAPPRPGLKAGARNLAIYRARRD